MNTKNIKKTMVLYIKAVQERKDLVRNRTEHSRKWEQHQKLLHALDKVVGVLGNDILKQIEV